tara:strand:+ start:988 stop:1470 length:483 start_codon:yes stop_codon:yes gene_type:complete
MKKLMLIVIIIGLVEVFSVLVSGQTFKDANEAFEDKDYNKAFKIWKPLAEQGKAEAQFNLGLMYEGGHGVIKDYEEAVKWYRLAAEQSLVWAQFNLGVMYRNGKGVNLDNTQAYKWYNIASAKGNESAQEFRDIIEKEMTPSQIAEAQRLAREWMESHRK